MHFERGDEIGKPISLLAKKLSTGNRTHGAIIILWCNNNTY